MEILDELTVRYSWSRPNPVPACDRGHHGGRDLPARPLPEAVPRALRRSGGFGGLGQADQVARLGPAVSAQGPARGVRQSRHADPAALAEHRRPAGAAFHRRTQHPLPPRRHERATAALSRPVRARGGRPKLVPIKTGAGETDLQFRHLFFKDYTFLKSSEERAACALARGPKVVARTLRFSPTSMPRIRSGAGCSATAVSARPCPWASTATCSASSSMSAWRSLRTIRSSRRARCFATSTGSAA